MALVAKSDQSTKNSCFASYVLQSGELVFTLTAPYSRCVLLPWHCSRHVGAGSTATFEGGCGRGPKANGHPGIMACIILPGVPGHIAS